MRPTQVRYDYVMAKARALKRDWKPGTPAQLRRILKLHKIRLEFVLDLQRPYAIKYCDDYIIALPPLDSDEQIRLAFIKQFAHIYLGHFDIYQAQSMTNDRVFINLTDKELKILESETHIFAQELAN